MIIDFHTHYFPEFIAKQTVDMLAEFSGIPYYGDGTINGLLEFMKKDGVSLSVNLPVATKPEQVPGINKKMVENNKKGLPVINFGCIHPLYKNNPEQLVFLAENGVKGIKIHPEYQNISPDDDSLLPVYETCVKHGLIILYHAGADHGYNEIHGTPKKFAEILKINGLKLVLAHMGSYQMWDDVEKYLVGKNVYFDTGDCNGMNNAQLKNMILNHSADKILFATDFPWESATNIINKIKSLNLGADIENKIFSDNAVKLLKL